MNQQESLAMKAKLQELATKLKQEKLLAQNKSAASDMLHSMRLQLSHMPDSVSVSARKI